MSVFLALPNSGSVDPRLASSLPAVSTKRDVIIHACTSSILVNTFNEQWCTMLNTPDISHFAMQHSDVGTEHYWLDTLIDELEKHDLDILSCVIAIKDDSGETSTGVLKENKGVDRLSLAQIKTLPVTFTEEDMQTVAKGQLLLNTGLWVAKYGEWMKDFPGFHQTSFINCNPDTKKYEVISFSEGWNFSLWTAKKGLKLAATSLLKVDHYGMKGWPNY